MLVRFEGTTHSWTNAALASSSPRKAGLGGDKHPRQVPRPLGLRHLVQPRQLHPKTCLCKYRIATLALFCVEADASLATSKWLKNASTSTAPIFRIERNLTIGLTRTPTLAMASPCSRSVLALYALLAPSPVNLGVRRREFQELSPNHPHYRSIRVNAVS